MDALRRVGRGSGRWAAAAAVVAVTVGLVAIALLGFEVVDTGSGWSAFWLRSRCRRRPVRACSRQG